MANDRLILRNGAVAESPILAVEGGGVQGLQNASEDNLHTGITSAPNPSRILEYGFTGEVLASQTAGESLTIGNVCYLRTNGSWYKASATQTASGDGLLGIALNTASSSSGVDILIRGIIGTNINMLKSIGSGVGQPIYLNTDSGTMSQTAPSSQNNIVRILGYYINLVFGQTEKYVISFNPDSIWLEL